MQQWLRLHAGCTVSNGFGGMQRWVFPDGRPYTKQPAIALEIFEAIDWATLKAAEMRKPLNG